MNFTNLMNTLRKRDPSVPAVLRQAQDDMAGGRDDRAVLSRQTIKELFVCLGLRQLVDHACDCFF
jgi:hypothetical protein